MLNLAITLFLNYTSIYQAEKFFLCKLLMNFKDSLIYLDGKSDKVDLNTGNLVCCSLISFTIATVHSGAKYC